MGSLSAAHRASDADLKCMWACGLVSVVQGQFVVAVAGFVVRHSLLRCYMDSPPCPFSLTKPVGMSHPSTHYRRSVGLAPAIVRALPPIPDFLTLFSVPPIVLDLTSSSMFYKIQINPVTNPLATLAINSEHLIDEFE